MTATPIRPVALPVRTDWEEIARQERERATALTLECDRLRALIGSDDVAYADSWLQRKVAAQRAALDRLNRKVLTQRFRLRLLASLGRDVTAAEYAVAVGALGATTRVDDYERVV